MSGHRGLEDIGTGGREVDIHTGSHSGFGIPEVALISEAAWPRGRRR
jgi:hypothetical protein